MCGYLRRQGLGGIEKAYKDSEVSGREYKRIVEYVEAMYNDLENDKAQNI